MVPGGGGGVVAVAPGRDGPLAIHRHWDGRRTSHSANKLRHSSQSGAGLSSAPGVAALWCSSLAAIPGGGGAASWPGGGVQGWRAAVAHGSVALTAWWVPSRSLVRRGSWCEGVVGRAREMQSPGPPSALRIGSWLIRQSGTRGLWRSRCCA